MKEPKQIKHDTTNETRLALLEQSVGSINQYLLEIKHDMKESSNKIELKFEKINNRMDSMFYWILGIAASTGVGIFLKLFMK